MHGAGSDSPGPGGGYAEATPGLSGRIRIYWSFVYPEEKEVRKDYEQERKIGRLVRVSDSVRHAQAQGLARRIHSAAKLRSRHRAESNAAK